jgi:hypothetical protein
MEFIMMKKVLAAAALASCALGAQAGLWVVPGNSDPTTFLDLTDATVFNQADIYSSSVPYIRLTPAGTDGTKFLAVGAGGNINDTTTVTLSALKEAPVTYASFLWGSPDMFNLLTVSTNDRDYLFSASFSDAPGLSFAFDGADVGYYVGFQVDGIADMSIDSLTFSYVEVPENAFEASNFSVTPVPEPETYALMLAGLGVVGFMARRRKAA